MVLQEWIHVVVVIVIVLRLNELLVLNVLKY